MLHSATSYNNLYNSLENILLKDSISRQFPPFFEMRKQVEIWDVKFIT